MNKVWFSFTDNSKENINTKEGNATHLVKLENNKLLHLDQAIDSDPNYRQLTINTITTPSH